MDIQLYFAIRKLQNHPNYDADLVRCQRNSYQAVLHHRMNCVELWQKFGQVCRMMPRKSLIKMAYKVDFRGSGKTGSSRKRWRDF